MALAPSSGPGPARESAELGQAPGRRRRENTVLQRCTPSGRDQVVAINLPVEG